MIDGTGALLTASAKLLRNRRFRVDELGHAHEAEIARPRDSFHGFLCDRFMLETRPVRLHGGLDNLVPDAREVAEMVDMAGMEREAEMDAGRFQLVPSLLELGR